MIIIQTNEFRKVVKKLHANQKSDLDKAVKAITKTPDIGEAKLGDLSGVFVYKFKMAKQLMLLAYRYSDEAITLTLLTLGSHENFYRDLKKSIKH